MLCCCSERRGFEIEAASHKEQAFGFGCCWSEFERSSGFGMLSIFFIVFSSSVCVCVCVFFFSLLNSILIAFIFGVLFE